MRRAICVGALGMGLWACGSSRTPPSDGGAHDSAASVVAAGDGSSPGAVDGGAADSPGPPVDGSAADALGDGATPDADFDAPPGPGNVAGRVVGPVGNGLADVPVIVAGQRTQTDSMGRFTASVAGPYELVVAYAAANGNRAVVIEGLTRSDPVVVVAAKGAPSGTVMMTGTLQGSYVSPQPSNMSTGVDAFSSDLSVLLQEQTPTGSPFHWPLAWGGPSQGTLDIVALQYASDGGVATSFSGFASVKQAVSDGQSLSIPLPLAPVTLSTLSGTATPANGFTIGTFSLAVHGSADPYSADRLDFSSQEVISKSPVSFSLPVPDLGPEFGITLFVDTTNSSSQATSSAYVANATSPVDVKLLPASVITSPLPSGMLGSPSQATGITMSTPFSWTSVPNATYRVSFTPSGAAVATLDIYTNSTSITLPDLSAVAMPWMSGATYDWRVDTFSPCTVDDAATFLGRLTQFPFTAQYPFTTVSAGGQFVVQ